MHAAVAALAVLGLLAAPHINRKTAHTLGVSIPPAVMVRATEVIR